MLRTGEARRGSLDMSFEVYVQCFQRGEPAGVPKAAVRALFPVDDAVSEPDYWTVRYDDLNWCHISTAPLTADDTRISSLCVFRPCSDLRLWDALFEVLRMGPVVLYYPGATGPLVADESATRHMPPDMAEVLGPPQVVYSGRQIVEDIERS